MKLFHRTDAAEVILTQGFRDAEGSYLSNATMRGVFLADVPVDDDEGATGDQLLEVLVDVDISNYELVEEGKPFREWCLPAQLLNDHGTTRLLSAEEAEDAEMERWTNPGQPGPKNL